MCHAGWRVPCIYFYCQEILRPGVNQLVYAGINILNQLNSEIKICKGNISKERLNNFLIDKEFYSVAEVLEAAT